MHRRHCSIMARCWAVPATLLFFTPLLFSSVAFVSSPKRAFCPTLALCASSRPVIDWAAQQTLQELVPKDNAYAIIDELIHNEALLDSAQDQFEENWASLEKRLRNEDRSLSQILGKTTTSRVLESVGNVKYDKDVVSTFLNSNAINSLFAVVLYDGISEFTVKIDVFGNIVNALPIIGPIRQQITKQFKESLDKSLGPLIRNFLKAYTKVAIQEAIDFVLSPQNQELFSSANRNLVNNILQRPVSTLVPSKDVSDELKDQVFTYLRNDVNMTDVQRYLDVAYDVVEDKSLENVVNVTQVLDASPTLESTLDSIWTKMKSVNTNE